MKRAGLFRDFEDAQRCVDAIQRGRAPVGATVSGWDMFFTNFGGRANVTRSSRGRELAVYGRQSWVPQIDRDYLAGPDGRDPVADFIVNTMTADAARIPITYDERIDDFLGSMRTKRLLMKGAAALARARMDRAAFVYVVASGDPSEPLGPGDKIRGFDYIRGYDLEEESIVSVDSDDPLLADHRIESVEWKIPDAYLEKDGKIQERKVLIHGHRLIPVREDLAARGPWTRPLLDVLFDDIWALRDLAFVLVDSQRIGNPFQVVVDEEHTFIDTDASRTAANEEMQKLRDGSRQHVNMDGVKVERIGASDLDDATNALTTTTGRVALRSGVPANMMRPSSRGSEQVTDQDRMDYASNVDAYSDRVWRPMLEQVTEIAKLVGMLPRKVAWPAEIDWPIVRTLGMREKTFIDKSDAATFKTALNAGRLPPARILRRFPKNTEPIDSRFVLPSFSAKVDDDGESVEEERSASAPPKKESSE